MLAREQLERLRQHHPVDLPDQAIALGRGQEPAGRHQLPGGIVGEPHERLVMRHLAVAQGHDRLVVQHERLLSQGAAQPRQPRAPVQARG